MPYDNSYEYDRLSFKPDGKRGQWSSSTDFIFICLGLALKLDLMPWYLMHESGVYGIIFYIICLAIYVVPIMVIQSFLGQFSSSGFISAFRVSPLFKGIGYISLLLNLLIVAYYSIFVAMPLQFLFNSLQPIPPWSCERQEEWLNAEQTNYGEDYNATFTTLQKNLCEKDIHGDYLAYKTPSALYFKAQYKDVRIQNTTISYSWQLVWCMCCTWLIVASILTSCLKAERFGKLLRYSLIVIFIMLLICFGRFMFLPGALENIKKYFLPQINTFDVTTSSLWFVLKTLGAGWGTIVSLASFNKFKTNVMRYSWCIVLGQLIITQIFCLLTFFLGEHLRSISASKYWEAERLLYWHSATAIGSLELSHLWCVLYYTMLSLAGLYVMVTQLFAILISIFDEFQCLRSCKQSVTITLICFLAICSLYFCTKQAIVDSTTLMADSMLPATLLNLLLLLVVLWVYGRARFQRDFEFMLNRPFANWKIHILRFLAPIFLIATLALQFMISLQNHFFFGDQLPVHVIALIFIVLPWLFIPIYAIYILIKTSGPFKLRWKRCCRPTNWYPAAAAERARYMDIVDDADVTRQLYNLTRTVKITKL